MSDRPSRCPGISIVCVFNDPDVRHECLDRSVEAYAGSGPVEYIPVDNTDHAFDSAGAALNHGARLARNPVVVFVHQDVYLHSLDRLLEVAAMLDGRWGVLGAAGVTSGGEVVGTMRDRVELIGRDAPAPVAVDSVDEVLFMVSRDVVLRNPISEDARLAWHAYAVELGVRLREQGLPTGAVNLEITHNSLTINLARLDVAHQQVAALHPASMPVRTTCGVVSLAPPVRRRVPLLRGQLWRYRWLRESMLAFRAGRRIAAPTVLSDVRLDVDAFELAGESPLQVVNLDREGAFGPAAGEPVELRRLGRAVVARSAPSLDRLLELIDALGDSGNALVTNVTLDDVSAIARHCAGRRAPSLVGVHENTMWLLFGALGAVPPQLRERRATPLLAPRRMAADPART